VDEEGLNIILDIAWCGRKPFSGGLAPALYHDDVITKVCFDKG
jgi:hypothetical protein